MPILGEISAHHYRLPAKELSLHLNFPERVLSENTARLISRLHSALTTATTSDIVLNLEKTQWFDLLPLAQILAIILHSRNQNTTLHIVGPATGVLPYLHPHLARLRARLGEGADETDHFRARDGIQRHEVVLPAQRRKAGAFLRRWGFFDAIEDNRERCRWYATRDQLVSLRALKDRYGTIYRDSETDRIRQLTVVQRDAQTVAMNRLNSEELIAGLLKKYTAQDLFRSGKLTNVLFFEPFENVFQHAYANPTPEDPAIYAMRIFTARNPSDKDERSSVLTSFLQRHQGQEILEIVVADAGQGVSATLSNTSASGTPLSALATLRYAFEASSTRRRPAPPGKRGLAWLKEHIAEIDGFVQLRSDGAVYELAYTGGVFAETDTPDERMPGYFIVTGPMGRREGPPGVGVQLLIPLKTTTPASKEPARYANWAASSGQTALLSTLRPDLYVKRVPAALLGDASAADWRRYLDAIIVPVEELVGFDLAQQHATRTALEFWFSELAVSPHLLGRSLILNCNRHNAARLPTVTALDELRRSHVVIPLFTPTLRTFLLGASEAEEIAFVNLLNQQNDATMLAEIAGASPSLFQWRGKTPVGTAFTIDTLERAMRRSLGDELLELLEQRGQLSYLRVALPFSPTLATTIAVEPHQLFADQDLARRICEHVALLMRRRYTVIAKTHHRVGVGLKDIAILTATRIGREFAVRMPKAFPREGFIFFDHHMIRPDRPTLLNR